MNAIAKKIIHSITPFTLLDYPDKTACILWFSGCNMKCSYCYNPEIVFGKGVLTIPETLDFLDKRRCLLDAVVLSGGECLLYKEAIDLLKAVKSMGFFVKVDTNGSMPLRLKELIALNLIDYVALDFKAPKHKTRSITKANFYKHFFECLTIIQNHSVAYEVRTTVHSDLLKEVDIVEMIHLLESNGYQGNYFLQQFRNNSITLQPLMNSKIIDYKHLSNHKIKVCMR